VDRLQAVSGPEAGNAGETDQDSTASVGLDAAIDKALGGITDQPASAPDKLKPSADDTTQPSDRAAAPKDQTKEQTDPAAPDKGNAGTTAPKHWPDERKAVFESLPTPEAKQAMLKLARDLEAGFTRKSQELSDQSKLGQTVSGLFTDAERRELQTINSNETAAIDYLLKLNRWAGQDPKAYIKWAMQTFEVKPDDLFGSPQPETKQETAPADQSSNLDDLLADPRLKALEAEFKPVKELVQNLQRNWDSLEQGRIQAEQTRRQNHVLSLVNGINQFRSELDDSGQLKHPHFDRLKGAMGGLMHTTLSHMPEGPEKMAKAYEMALRADPELHQEWVKHETAKAVEADRKQRDAAKARAATGIKPAIGVAQASSRTSSLDSAIEGAMSRFGM